MRNLLIVLWMLFWSVNSAIAQVNIGIGLPDVNIGINLPMFPELVQIPGYPVYYAPQLQSNFFFYDGMYWAYQRDNWYASSWYNGPWGLVAPESVPLFVLRIPVRYYRDPPSYFRGWVSDAPPRWGEHWGNEWEQHRRGWDSWNRRSVPAPAPLPLYQRQYSGNRYPRAEQQQTLRSQNYRYQPRDAVVRQQYQGRAAQNAPAPSQRTQQETPQERSFKQPEMQRSNPPLQVRQGSPTVPRPQPPTTGREYIQRPAPTQGPRRQEGAPAPDQTHQPQQGGRPREQQAPQQGARPREQQAPRSGQEKDHEKRE